MGWRFASKPIQRLHGDFSLFANNGSSSSSWIRSRSTRTKGCARRKFGKGMISMDCKVCSSQTAPHATTAILQGKYTISYFYCPVCGFVQTETPYWLAEAYARAIDVGDSGLVRRNLQMAILTRALIQSGFDPKAIFLDWRRVWTVCTIDA